MKAALDGGCGCVLDGGWWVVDSGCALDGGWWLVDSSCALNGGWWLVDGGWSSADRGSAMNQFAILYEGRFTKPAVR